MFKSILFAIFTVLTFLASSVQAQEAAPKNGATETGYQMKVKNSKREEALLAELNKKAAEREAKSQAREERLNKLHADLATKAEERAKKVYK